MSTRDPEPLAEAGLEPSVGCEGEPHDDALAETLDGLQKAGVIHRRSSWRTREEVEGATLHGVERFNNRRRVEPTGKVPPAEAGSNAGSKAAGTAAMA